MILKVFTKDDYEESRDAKEFGTRLEQEGYIVEYYDADDQHVTEMLELYDIYSYPTFLVSTEDGVEVECWRGITPLESDLKMFLNG
jgi:hypothetical protein